MSYFLAAAVALFLSFPQVAFEGYPAEISKEDDEPPGKHTSWALPEELEKIAYCESQSRHYDEKGNVLRGEINRYDIGKYQINELYWKELADELGHNIFEEKGNEAMALVLYEKYGTRPWKASEKCWRA